MRRLDEMGKKQGMNHGGLDYNEFKEPRLVGWTNAGRRDRCSDDDIWSDVRSGQNGNDQENL